MIIVLRVAFSQQNNSNDFDQNKISESSQSSVFFSSPSPEEDPNLTLEDFENLETNIKIQNLVKDRHKSRPIKSRDIL